MNIDSLNPRRWFNTPEQEVKKEFASHVSAYRTLFKRLTNQGHILESLLGQTQQLSSEDDTRLSAHQKKIRDTFKAKIIHTLQQKERKLWNSFTQDETPHCRQIVEDYLDKMLISDTISFCNLFADKEPCKTLLNDPAFIDSL